MLAVYVVALSAGSMMIVPTLLQAIDRGRTQAAADRGEGRGPFAFVAFLATAVGIAGIVIQQFDVDGLVTFIAALALGVAAGAVHPEVLGLLEDRGRSQARG